MNRNIVKNILQLSFKAEPVTQKDSWLIQDLKDTLTENSERCVGMAANMIGINKAAIIVALTMGQLVMLNPQITSSSGQYETMEGCLSLTGERKAVRYQTIEVRYQDESFIWQKQKFTGYIAQIIQHECDHLKGIII